MSMIGGLASALACATLSWPCPTDAAERGTLPALPRPGDVIPRSVAIAGIDGEPMPRDFGLLVMDGRVILVIEGRSRRVVQVLDEEFYARGPPAFRAPRP